jgi:hypothetical protein
MTVFYFLLRVAKVEELDKSLKQLLAADLRLLIIISCV